MMGSPPPSAPFAPLVLLRSDSGGEDARLLEFAGEPERVDGGMTVVESAAEAAVDELMET